MKVFFVSVFLFFASLTFAQDFYFVQITDTHLAYKDHDRITDSIVKSINQLPFDVKFVVHTGDIFQNNLHEKKARKSFKSIKEQIQTPLYVVPGNHDLLPDQYKKHRKLYVKHVAPLNQIVEVEGVQMILYYSIPLADTLLPDLSEQKAWIENVLDSLKHEPKIVFHHQPSVKDFYLNADHDSWPETMRIYWEKLVNTYQVNAIVTGHFHRDELHWLGNVPLYVAPSIAGFWGRQASYRIYHYQDGHLSYKTVYYYE